MYYHLVGNVHATNDLWLLNGFSHDGEYTIKDEILARIIFGEIPYDKTFMPPKN